MLILLTFHFSINQGSVQRSTEGDRAIAGSLWCRRSGKLRLCCFSRNFAEIWLRKIRKSLPTKNLDSFENCNQNSMKANMCLTKIITKSPQTINISDESFWTVGLLWSDLILTFVFGGGGHGSQLVLSCWNQDASKMVTILSWPMSLCNLHEVCRVLYNDCIFVDAFFFLSGYFNSILSTMGILSCPVFVSLVFESIGIRQFSTCFQNFFCTLNLVNSSFNMLFGLVASLFGPPRWHGFVKVPQKWKAMAQAKGLGGVWDKSLEMSWHVKIALHLHFSPTNLPLVRISLMPRDFHGFGIWRFPSWLSAFPWRFGTPL